MGERYLGEIPKAAWASRPSSLSSGTLSEENLERVQTLSVIAIERGQKVSQPALSWVLRDPLLTSLVVGASSVTKLEENAVGLGNISFTAEEPERIDRSAADGDIDLWRGPGTS